MPPKNYPGRRITAKTIALNPRKETITNVISAFDNIPLSGDFTPLLSHKTLTDADTYNPYNSNDFRIDAGRKRHFQGLARSLDGKYLFVSGGDHTHNPQVAQIFLCKLKGNSTDREELGIEPHNGRITQGTLEEIYVVDSGRFWHNGGISLFGNVLILPLESDGYLPKQKNDTKESLIKFLDTTNPKKPSDLHIDIQRVGTNAGTASMVRLSNGYYLCAVWTDSDPSGQRNLDFYISNSTNLKLGFHSKFIRHVHSEAHKGVNPKYQSIKLILQDDDKLFMIGTENSYGWSPLPPGVGRNRARLYEIHYDLKNATKNAFTSFSVTTSIIRGTNTKIFKGGGKRYNFNGAAGIYLTPDDSLALYASHHRTYDDGNIIPCTEFYPSFPNPTINQLSDALIELYEDDTYRGRCLRIRGYHNNTSISDYKRLRVEDDHFNDKVSSIRFQLPIGKKYYLYPDKQYGGTPIELEGTGELVEISNIHSSRLKKKAGVYLIPKKMGDKISSSKF